MLKSLDEDLSKEIAKSTGKSKALTIVKRLLKFKEDIPEWNCIYRFDGEDCFARSDFAIKMYEEIPFTLIKNEKLRDNLYRLFSDIPNSNTDIMEIPNIVELKKALKINKKSKILYYFRADEENANKCYCLNAKRLVDIIELIDATEIHIPDKFSTPCFLKGNKGEAILLPIRPPLRKETGICVL